MIHFECGNCGKSLKTPDEHAGKTVQCPACNHPITVPNASAEIDIPPAPARTTRNVRRTTRRSQGSSDHVLVRIGDGILNAIHRMTGGSDRAAFSSFCLKQGIWCGLILLAGMLSISIYTAIKSGSVMPMNQGLAGAILLLALLYSAGKCRTAMVQSASRLDCPVHRAGVLRAIALLNIGVGIFIMWAGIENAVTRRNTDSLIWSIPIGLVVCYFAVVLMPTSEQDQDETAEVSLAQDALALVRHGWKAWLWTAPVMFLLGLAISSGFLVYHLVRFWTTEGREQMRYLVSAMDDTGVGVFAAASPLVIYLLMLLVGVIIEVIEAIISSRHTPARP